MFLAEKIKCSTFSYIFNFFPLFYFSFLFFLFFGKLELCYLVCDLQ